MLPLLVRIYFDKRGFRPPIAIRNENEVDQRHGLLHPPAGPPVHPRDGSGFQTGRHDRHHPQRPLRASHLERRWPYAGVLDRQHRLSGLVRGRRPRGRVPATAALPRMWLSMARRPCSNPAAPPTSCFSAPVRRSRGPSPGSLTPRRCTFRRAGGPRTGAGSFSAGCGIARRPST